MRGDMFTPDRSSGCKVFCILGGEGEAPESRNLHLAMNAPVKLNSEDKDKSKPMSCGDGSPLIKTQQSFSTHEPHAPQPGFAQSQVRIDLKSINEEQQSQVSGFARRRITGHKRKNSRILTPCEPIEEELKGEEPPSTTKNISRGPVTSGFDQAVGAGGQSSQIRNSEAPPSAFDSHHDA